MSDIISNLKDDISAPKDDVSAAKGDIGDGKKVTQASPVTSIKPLRNLEEPEGSNNLVNKDGDDWVDLLPHFMSNKIRERLRREREQN